MSRRSRQSRPSIVAFAVFAALLVVTATPVIAGHLTTKTAVGSVHTNDTDFNSATTLDDVTVNGTGVSAFVELSNETFSDGFENEAADAGVPNNWESTNAGDQINVTTSRSHTGSQSTYADDYRIRPSEQPYASARTENVSAWFFGINNGNANPIQLRLIESGNNRIIVVQNESDGDLWNIAGTNSKITTDVDAREWFKVKIYDINPSANTFSVEWETEAGESGTATGLSMFSSMSNGWDESEVWLGGGGVESGYVDDVNIGKDADKGTYISQNHSVDRPTTGFTNLTLTNAEATVSWLADTDGDGTFETTAASSTFTTTGNHTLDVSGTSASSWRVNVTLKNQTTNGEPTARLHDEGLQFTDHEPAIDNSSGTPTGDISTDDPTLKIDVNDTEFSTVQGDSVTVEFFVDGTSVGTDTLTSNGTASVTASNLNGGDHTWNATATDSYGLSNTSQDFSISIPANLTIRNETSPHGLITGSNAKVTFYELNDDNPTIIERSDSNNDGNISLSGLPVGSSFAVTVQAPGYHNRTVLIDDIFTQSNVFLLEKTHTASEITFTVDDPTGAFTGSDAEIQVQRAINQSKYNTGGVAWLTIAGDRTGAANQLVVNLQQDTRHRLKVSNDDETRIVGSYTPVADDTVTLRPTAPSINVTDVETFNWNVSYTNTTTGGTITFEYFDPNSSTTDLDVYIYEQGNKSNDFVVQTAAGPMGYTKITQTLTESQSDKNWVVEWNATYDGEEVGGETVIGQRIEELITELDDTWQNALAVMAIILTGGLFSVVNVRAGAVVTSFVGGGFVMAGWLPTAALGAALVALFIAIVWKAAGGGV